MNAQFKLLAVLVLVGLGAPARAQEAALDRARSLLRSTREQQVREGARICLAAQSAKGVALLFEVLERTAKHAGNALAPAHYRDIVWDELTRFTGKQARDRVARELRTNQKNRYVREWCAKLLGIYGEQRFGPLLVKALSDRWLGVRREAARSLGWLRFAPAVSALLKLSRHKNIYLRANAVESLARIDPGTHRVALVGAIQHDPDGGVRCALLGALPGISPAEVEARSIAALRDVDWRPRMQAVENLSRIKTKTSVDALIEAVHDGRPVVSHAALVVLQQLTGKEIGDYESWKSWWAAHRATFEFPEGVKKAVANGERKSVAYNGIPLVSDHVAFLIDKSLRMRDRLQSKAMSKDGAAHEELKRVLSKLHGRMVFNVFLYREAVDAFRKKPVSLDPKTQKKALAFVAKQTTTGAKDIWMVLERVVRDPTLDTAYLLSSGEPDVGLYVHWNRVTDHLKDLNRFHKMVVHTVVYSQRKWFRDQLEKIAEATGGQFKWFQ